MCHTILRSAGSLLAFFIPMFVMVPSYIMTVRLLSRRAKFVRNDSLLLTNSTPNQQTGNQLSPGSVDNNYGGVATAARSQQETTHGFTSGGALHQNRSSSSFNPSASATTPKWSSMGRTSFRSLIRLADKTRNAASKIKQVRNQSEDPVDVQPAAVSGVVVVADAELKGNTEPTNGQNVSTNGVIQTMVASPIALLEGDALKNTSFIDDGSGEEEEANKGRRADLREGGGGGGGIRVDLEGTVPLSSGSSSWLDSEEDSDMNKSSSIKGPIQPAGRKLNSPTIAPPRRQSIGKESSRRIRKGKSALKLTCSKCIVGNRANDGQTGRLRVCKESTCISCPPPTSLSSSSALTNGTRCNCSTGRANLASSRSFCCLLGSARSNRLGSPVSQSQAPAQLSIVVPRPWELCQKSIMMTESAPSALPGQAKSVCLPQAFKHIAGQRLLDDPSIGGSGEQLVGCRKEIGSASQLVILSTVSMDFSTAFASAAPRSQQQLAAWLDMAGANEQSGANKLLTETTTTATTITSHPPTLMTKKAHGRHYHGTATAAANFGLSTSRQADKIQRSEILLPALSSPSPTESDQSPFEVCVTSRLEHCNGSGQAATTMTRPNK